MFISEPFKISYGNHRYLRCPYLQDKNFGVLRSSITLDKADLVCSETLKDKPTINDSGLITYSNQSILMVYYYTAVVTL